MWGLGLLPGCGARASHRDASSSRGSGSRALASGVVAWGFSCPEAGGISFPRSGIEPGISRQILNHGATREVPRRC